MHSLPEYADRHDAPEITIEGVIQKLKRVEYVFDSRYPACTRIQMQVSVDTSEGTMVAIGTRPVSLVLAGAGDHIRFRAKAYKAGKSDWVFYFSWPKEGVMFDAKAKYRGVRKRLKGKTAAVYKINDTELMAQFDDIRVPECHGWHKFKIKDFTRG